MEESYVVSIDLFINRLGDDVFYFWLLKFVVQYDKICIFDGSNVLENSFIKMWLFLVFFDFVEKNLVEGIMIKFFDGIERLYENGNKDKDEKVEDV